MAESSSTCTYEWYAMIAKKIKKNYTDALNAEHLAVTIDCLYPRT